MVTEFFSSTDFILDSELRDEISVVEDLIENNLDRKVKLVNIDFTNLINKYIPFFENLIKETLLESFVIDEKYVKDFKIGHSMITRLEMMLIENFSNLVLDRDIQVLSRILVSLNHHYIIELIDYIKGVKKPGNEDLNSLHEFYNYYIENLTNKLKLSLDDFFKDLKTLINLNINLDSNLFLVPKTWTMIHEDDIKYFLTTIIIYLKGVSYDEIKHIYNN